MDITELEKKIDAYFLNISDEQLQIDLDKAGYEFYKHVNVRLFSDIDMNQFEEK